MDHESSSLGSMPSSPQPPPEPLVSLNPLPSSNTIHNLQTRVAVLEAEIAREKWECTKARTANTYLLELMTGSQTNRSSDEAVRRTELELSNAKGYEREPNRSLRKSRNTGLRSPGNLHQRRGQTNEAITASDYASSDAQSIFDFSMTTGTPISSGAFHEPQAQYETFTPQKKNSKAPLYDGEEPFQNVFAQRFSTRTSTIKRRNQGRKTSSASVESLAKVSPRPKAAKKVSRKTKVNRFTGEEAMTEPKEATPLEWFGGHGNVVFQPPPGTPGTRRTVIMGGLLPGTSLSEVLENVRGGMVSSAEIHDTTNITGTWTASIVFFAQKSAKAYAEYVRNHPIWIRNSRVVVTNLSTPTAPIQNRELAGVEKHQHTRCIVVHSSRPHKSVAELKRQFQLGPSHDSHGIIATKMDKFGDLMISFKSVDKAGWAFAKVANFRDFAGDEVSRAPDPCSRPMKTIRSGYGPIVPAPGSTGQDYRTVGEGHPRDYGFVIKKQGRSMYNKSKPLAQTADVSLARYGPAAQPKFGSTTVQTPSETYHPSDDFETSDGESESEEDLITFDG